MATKFNRILVGVDDSADALLAFEYALHQVKRDDAELYIVSVLESDDMSVYEALSKDFVHGERQALEQHIQDYQRQAKEAGLTKVHALVADGEPGETIVKDVIPHVQPDLLIIGSEAKKGVRRHFGSQAAYMAKYSPISVLVIR
ncbi:universal stress protein [Levilactobacillus zymae]|uniref:universal stress protein n=1 Tax=Levilactobacillus zymae TaxID=267363 RepID=UPI003FCC27A6